MTDSHFGMAGPSDGARERDMNITDKAFSFEARSENEQNSCRTVNKGKWAAWLENYRHTNKQWLGNKETVSKISYPSLPGAFDLHSQYLHFESTVSSRPQHYKLLEKSAQILYITRKIHDHCLLNEWPVKEQHKEGGIPSESVNILPLAKLTKF